MKKMNTIHNYKENTFPPLGVRGLLTVVGAGPGDVDLITVKAIKVLKTADVVLYDGLVNEEILMCFLLHLRRKKLFL